MPIEHNPKYVHHQSPGFAATVREVVFGMEDGMVSTLGAITGIASATQDRFTVVLAGLVVVAVESIAMAVGSFLSSKSEREIDEEKLREERTEIEKFPKEEHEELLEMCKHDGWPADLAKKMAETASQNNELMLKEMAYRELAIAPEALGRPALNAVYMFFSYIVGGAIPIVFYLFLPVRGAILPSIAITFVGLFALGAGTTKFSKRPWWRAGLEMLILGGAAAFVGYAVGQAVDVW